MAIVSGAIVSGAIVSGWQYASSAARGRASAVGSSIAPDAILCGLGGRFGDSGTGLEAARSICVHPRLKFAVLCSNDHQPKLGPRYHGRHMMEGR